MLVLSSAGLLDCWLQSCGMQAYAMVCHDDCFSVQSKTVLRAKKLSTMRWCHCTDDERSTTLHRPWLGRWKHTVYIPSINKQSTGTTGPAVALDT